MMLVSSKPETKVKTLTPDVLLASLLMSKGLHREVKAAKGILPEKSGAIREHEFDMKNPTVEAHGYFEAHTTVKSRFGIIIHPTEISGFRSTIHHYWHYRKKWICQQPSIL